MATSLPIPTKLPKVKLTKKNIFIIVIVLLVALGIYFRFFTPKSALPSKTTVPVVNNVLFPGPKVIKPEHLNFDLEPFTPPSSVTLYSAQNSATPNTLITNITQKYNLTVHPNIPTYYVSTDNKASLTFSPVTNILSLNLSLDLKPLVTADKQKALTAANEFLSSLGLNNLVATTNDITYLQGSSELTPTTDPAKAVIYQIPFTLKTDNLPIYFNPKLVAPATLLVNSTFQVTKAVFTAANLTLSPLGSNKPLSVETAVANIKAGGYTYYQSLDRQGLNLPPKASHELFFTKVSLVYLYLPDQNQLLPYYLLSGQIRFSEPYPIGTVEIITPAVGQ